MVKLKFPINLTCMFEFARELEKPRDAGKARKLHTGWCGLEPTTFSL